MKRITSITIGVLLSAVVAQGAAAQFNVARYETERNRVYTTFGLDPALVTSIGYARVVAPFGHEVQLSGEVGLVAANMDTRDFRTRLELQTSLVRWKSFAVAGSATFITRGTENVVYRGLNFGADFTGTAGVYRHGWFAASEFGFDKAVITHVTHTDWYRDHYFADAKDGWYLNAGGNFHYGLVTGVALGRVELAGRAGWQKTEDFSPLLSPFYGSIGVGFSF